MNEAPGPDEAASRIPLYGQQGANLFHALRTAGIAWAANYEEFIWPRSDSVCHSVRQSQKKSFLAMRAKYITCTNAYPYWPKPKDHADQFCPPRTRDVCASKNVNRISKEILPTHSVLLICGKYAYLACTGDDLSHPAEREFKELMNEEIEMANTRLSAHFEKGWYMGHTRRWSLSGHRCSKSLRELAEYLNWPLSN